MKKIAWISPYIPYDSVRHAGGQTHNYYIKKLVESHKFEVRLISSYLPDEIQHFTLDKEIHCDLICNYSNGIKRLFRNILDAYGLLCPFDRYGNQKTFYNELMMKRILRGYKKEGFVPDIIILEWTQSIFSLDSVKRIFPDAKIVGIEEDVSIQGLKRWLKKEQGIKKALTKIRLKNVEREEIRTLNKCSLVITNNSKDTEILQQYGVKRPIEKWVPFYHSYENIHGSYSNNVIYYGNMRRPENYSAAEWFIKEVMPQLNNINVLFQVIGSNPPEELKKQETDNITVTGYQKDIKPYLENALCLIAPLSLGAGIKVKILEGMSAGLPVLTNKIGIEGIPAVDGRDYIHCDTPEDYAAAIRDLISGEISPAEIGQNARQLLKENLNYAQAAEDFINWLMEL